MKEILLSSKGEVEPFSLRDAPSLIESLFPAQKISAEAQKERKAGNGQTLTALGNYWKGRKPLILNKACILGVLLPATKDTERDLEIFEKLMAIDDGSFKHRAKSAVLAENIASLPYLQRLAPAMSYRPEEIPDHDLFGDIWADVNNHLGTNALSFQDLIEQLGVMRFGRKPRVADTFSGSGQISFEAARLGCDVYASDLNPIACLLTWAALNIVGADVTTRGRIAQAQKRLSEAVDREIISMGIEHDSQGNRAKAFLYCLETRCPQTGWMVPLMPSLVIAKTNNIVARLIPDHKNKRFDIDVVANVSDEEMIAAEQGTVQDDSLVFRLEQEEYRTPIKTIRGDFKQPNGAPSNRLRRWDKHDCKPRPEDIFQERLYAIQWASQENGGSNRSSRTFFLSVRDEDLRREASVYKTVEQNLEDWQSTGMVPDMPIENGDKTDEPIKTRGWTHWHHLFSPRQLLLLSLFKKHAALLEGIDAAACLVYFCAVLNSSSKLCRLDPSGGNVGRAPKIIRVFDNQALNPLFNWAERAFPYLYSLESDYKKFPLPDRISTKISCAPATGKSEQCDYFITDPPYADAVQYHEITEFFIAWLRKNPPELFKEWTWDSRRALAIKGSGEDFRSEMVRAYKTMSEFMSDNGRQIVMFTHQDPSVWADMASIMWGAGLQVTAAWYIATETTSELKKGGYVQGTVVLVLRKRFKHEAAYRDELVQEVKAEVERQIDTLVGLNQSTKGHGRAENLFEDADLQMAGYAAALRVLTGYTHIDGRDMTAEALRPRIKGEKGLVGEIIDFAVQVANEHLVPEGLSSTIWDALTGSQRFYLKMMDLEAAGLKKLDNYQNFAKAFRIDNYTALMSSTKANNARLKTGYEFKKTEFEGDFGQSGLRAVLFALYELQKELDSDEVMSHLRDLIPGYHGRRDELMSLAEYIALKRAQSNPEEAEAARILLGRIQNERLGG
jgi:putative DNA methylase